MIRILLVPALLATAAAPALAQTAPATTARPATTAQAQPTTAAPAAGTPATTAPTTATAPAGANPAVGGAAMDATKPIPVNAAAAPNLSTLVSAVKAAGLDATLSGPGPFTVFAPTNDAFGRLAPGTVDTLLKPENKASLTKVLTYHVVPGTITLADLQARLKSGSGTTTLTTVEGEPITVRLEGNAISLSDVSGNKSYIETPDVRQSNGVVHVVNGVLVPKLN
jgi:uncharacterized surface protein with fasciclin (FAS1) repeats